VAKFICLKGSTMVKKIKIGCPDGGNTLQFLHLEKISPS
jgi:hypothetical protein